MIGRFIKFPSSIPPDRVTPSIVRVQELKRSPLTNAQQIAHRGNAAWRWTFEFKDLSEQERDVVQAFLLSAEGALARFKVSDPAMYDPSSYVSASVLDVFGGRGSFTRAAEVSSYFEHGENFSRRITDDFDARYEWRTVSSSPNLRWSGHGAAGLVSSLEVGRTYVQRVKFFQNPLKVAAECFVRVGSDSDASVSNGPATTVRSSGSVTVPFLSSASSHSLAVMAVPDDGVVGDYWRLADYRLSRCALISNSENLLLNSNGFSSWTLTNVSVTSGYGADPRGGNLSWLILVNSTDATHRIDQTISKVSTEDIYTASVYARAKDFSRLRVRIDDGGSVDAYANFSLLDGSVSSVTNSGFERAVAETFDVGSGWYRCRLTAVSNSASSIRMVCYVMSGSAINFSGSTSEGLEIYGAQLRKFPHMGHYCETENVALVGTGWQTGSNVIVDGLDPGQRIRHGARAEIVTRFYNANSDYFERSEFKRLRSESVVHREGWAVLEIEPRIRNAPVTDRTNTFSTDHVGETMHNPVIFDSPEMTARIIAGTVQEIEKPLMMYDVTFDVLEDLTE